MSVDTCRVRSSSHSEAAACRGGKPSAAQHGVWLLHAKHVHVLPLVLGGAADCSGRTGGHQAQIADMKLSQNAGRVCGCDLQRESQGQEPRSVLQTLAGCTSCCCPQLLAASSGNHLGEDELGVG
jgi:hypothetical protein